MMGAIFWSYYFKTLTFSSSETVRDRVMVSNLSAQLEEIDMFVITGCGLGPMSGTSETSSLEKMV